MRLKEFTKASSDFDRAIKLDPRLGLAYFYRSELDRQQGKSPEQDLQSAERLGCAVNSVAIKP